MRKMFCVCVCVGGGGYPIDNVAGEIRKPLGMVQVCKSSSPACNWNLDVLKKLDFFYHNVVWEVQTLSH